MMAKHLSKRNRDFLRYINDQKLGRIDIGFIDGSTRPIAPLVRAGLLRRDGKEISITEAGREELWR
jgi:hypothetical protein